MAPSSSKMSLAAQFDDFCRQSFQFDTVDEEFLAFVKNQEECRKRWHAAELELLRQQTENNALKNDNKELNQKLIHTKEVLEKMVARCERLEEEKEAKVKQLELIRQFILNDPDLKDETIEKLAFLKPHHESHADDGHRLTRIDESVGSVLSPSADSLDLSDEEEGRGRRSSRLRGKRSVNRDEVDAGDVIAYKRRTRSAGKEEPKQSNVITTTTVTVTDGKDFVATSRVFTQPMCHTVTNAAPLPGSITPASAANPAFSSKGGSGCTTPLGSQNGTAPPRRSNSAGKLSSRAHNFCTKTLVRSESCGPCGKRIGFYKTALKCLTCRSTCHPECKDQVPLPCIQVPITPNRKGTAGGQKSTTIADHVPSTAPMVPSIVVHCLQEVEQRGLSEVGLYRVSGSEREVREIREHFQRGKGVPDLSKADIHAVCGAVKDFLRSLRETLITKSLWGAFVKAAEQEEGSRVSATWQAVSQLPPPNQDTLAFLVLHLQLIASTPQCKMPINNLARVFGPTVVGFSSSDMAAVSNVLYETEKQAQVMESILNVPAYFWKSFIDVDTDEDLKTPERKQVPQSVLLGPLSGSWGKKTMTSHTPYRFSTGGTRKKGYFSSPAMN